MFNLDEMRRKRIVIQHTVQALDGHVDLTTTVDLSNVSEDKVFLWAATNRLTRWLDSLQIGRLTSAEVKERFDDLIIECKGDFQSYTQPSLWEEKIIIDNFSKVLGEGVSVEKVLQALIRSTLKLAH